MSPRLKILCFCIASFLLVGCDQVTKRIVEDHLIEGVSTSYLNDTFRLIYVRNTGAALNLGDELPPAASFWLLSAIPLLILIGLTIYVFKNIQTISPSRAFAFCLIVAGGIGNIIDRIAFDRHVTDFLNVGIGGFRTGIFNLADVCVTIGAVVLLLSSLRKRKAIRGSIDSVGRQSL